MKNLSLKNKLSAKHTINLIDNKVASKAINKTERLLPKFLSTSITAVVLSLSGHAIAANNSTQPVNSIEDIISNSDNDGTIYIAKDSRIVTLDEVPVGEPASVKSNDAMAKKAKIEVVEVIQEPEYIDDETKAVQAQVDNEIKNQSVASLEAETGEVVASTSATDEGAIDSIESSSGTKRISLNLFDYAKKVNSATWSPKMQKNTAMTVKLQTLLDWNHASPGPIDGGWGMNSKKALTNFQAMQGLPATGKLNEATWNALNKNISAETPVLVSYTITKQDVNTKFTSIPSGSAAKSKLKKLEYQNIKEMLAERFHMDVRYLQKLNKSKNFKAGETITVINKGKPLKSPINRVVANKADKTLYAYNGKKLVATYPTTVGSSSTPSPSGTFKIVNKVKMPQYKATVGSGDSKKVYYLAPGPNSPVGVVWMGLSKPSYGIHGSPIPEGISRQASHGCIRLTNWDALEVHANIKNGAKVELK